MLLYKAGLLPALLLLLYSNHNFAQIKNAFPEFEQYGRWGFRAAGVMYNKGQTNHHFGPNTIQTYPMPDYGFGFVKVINPTDKISYKTGIYLDKTPFYKIRFKIAPYDIYPEFNGADEIPKMIDRFVITIPLLAQFKKQMDYNLYFNLEAGLHIAFMVKSEGGGEHTYINANMTESRTVFGIYAHTLDNVSVYPNLILSPGFYFTFDKMLIQANVIYQKTLINYHKGEYQYANLLVSEGSRGDYKMSGDYIGLSFNIHALKRKYWKKRNKKDDDDLDY